MSDGILKRAHICRDGRDVGEWWPFQFLFYFNFFIDTNDKVVSFISGMVVQLSIIPTTTANGFVTSDNLLPMALFSPLGCKIKTI